MTTTQEEATAGAITQMLEEKLLEHPEGTIEMMRYINSLFDKFLPQVKALELQQIEQAKANEQARIVGILDEMLTN